MNQWFRNFSEQLRALPPGRRLVLAATGAGSLAFFLWLIVGAGSPEYRALYRGLPEDEVAQVADALRSEKIPYELADGGTTLLVPAAQVYEARIRVAGRGLPRGGSEGFEIFDRPAFGVTDFVHHVNFARALQGELARSIEQLEPVERARVQVVIPERRSVISARQRQPSAAVVLRMRAGRSLDPEQVQAVVHLVASSIESLAPDQVTVVDDAGRLLAPQEDGAGGTTHAGGAAAYQGRVESELAERIETLLEKTVGMGSVVARVRADLDWTESETTEERFDPDSQVARSEHRTSDQSSDGSGIEGGIPGIAANSPDAAVPGATAGTTGSNATRSSETLNYEISKIVSRRVTPRGGIERLSIAVLVADPPGEGGAEPTPWNQESLGRFEELAKQAVGFSAERGDRITVTSAPFRSPALELEGEGVLGPELLLLLGTVVRALAVLLGVFAFARFVLRPLLGSLSAGLPTALPARVAELEARLAAWGELAAQAGERPKQLRETAGGRGDESVQMLKSWLNQG